MVSTILILLLTQITPGPPKPSGVGGCAGESAEHVRLAEARGEALDLTGASEAYFTAASLGCPEAEVSAHYLRGLLAARDAYRVGGSPESLEPVRQAVSALEARGATTRGIAEVARFVLLAASAAAQSERDEMALLLEHAIQLETIQLEARQRGTPGATAHEVAGDLYLQVHRYEDARSYYTKAAERLGMTPRVMLGLARTAARLEDTRVACDQYRALIAWWGPPSPDGFGGTSRGEPPDELTEARAVADTPACQASPRR